MALGVALARVLVPGDMVLLAGDLGAGKTTLTKGLAAGLGITETVTSPTFTLVRSYQGSDGDRFDASKEGGSGRPVRPVRTLVHADLFRLDLFKEVIELALDELLEEEDAAAVIEWGDVAVPVLGRDCLIVRLANSSGASERELTVEVPNGWEPRLGDLRLAFRSAQPRELDASPEDAEPG